MADTSHLHTEISAPKHKTIDVVYILVKGALSLIPLGGLLSEVVSVASPMDKRRDEWVQAVAESLHALSDQVEAINIDTLAENEVFVTTLLKATRSAISTHRKETRQALRNAVLNAALPNAPSDIQQHIFIQWLDELTTWHVKILELFGNGAMPPLNLADPQWVMNVEVDRVSDFIENAYPEMIGQHPLEIQVLRDLSSKGLIANLIPGKNTMTAIEHSPKLTPVAKDFLDFIKSPLEEDDSKS